MLAVSVSAIAGAWYWQKARTQSFLVSQARVFLKTGNNDLAISFVNKYLAEKPRDLAALNLKGEILAGSARTPAHLDEVIQLSEMILRLNSDPKDPASIEQAQETQRRLIGAYLSKGMMVGPEERKFTTAESLAKELANRTGSAADIRLHARTLEALGIAGSRPRFAEAAAEYEKAIALDPKDIDGAEQAAKLYFFAIKNSDKAIAVLDALVRDNPTAPALLAAARVDSEIAVDHASAGRFAEAAKLREKVDGLLKKAIAASPHGLAVRLAAADLAIGMRRPAEAAAHLAEVEEKDRKDYRYRTLQGIVELYDNKTADAIESWKRGLIATEGSDAELSWRLAYVLLQLGRVDEAEPLINQYRRNAGGEETSAAARYLEALKLLKLNRPVNALAELEKTRLKVLPSLKAQYYYTMGQAREATRDDGKAMEDYAVAIEADPKLAAPRLARARLLQARRPEDAYDEVRKGLAESGEDPALLATMARLELAKQKRLPSSKQNWTALEGFLERGREAAPAMAAMAIVRAEAMATMGKGEKGQDAANLLKTAVAIDKTDPDLLIAYAERLTSLGRFEDALVALDQASDPKILGDNAKVRILRAKILTLQGHGREARDGLVRDQERIRPDQRPLLWMALGELYAAQGDLPSARKAYAEWAKLLPQDPLPRLFVLELSLNDTSPEAEAIAQESVKVLTEQVGGLFGRIGEATYLLRDRTGGKEPADARATRLARAERFISRIETDTPALRYGPLLRGLLSEQKGEQEKAVEAYEKTLKTDGGQAVLPRLVQLYSSLKRDEDLKRLRETYADTAPGIARVTAELYAKQGDKEKAEELARQVVEGNADSLDARVWQARVLNSLGKPEEAEKTLRNLVEKNPESLGARLALMYFQISRKETKKAIETVEDMIKNVKNIERPEMVWGQAWRAVGERDRADSAFEAALSRWPNDPQVTRAVAEYYSATNRTPQAEKTLRDVIKRDSTQRWATRQLALIISSRPGDRAGWRTAWDMVKDPALGGDLPEDRLIRALVLARGNDAANRTEAADMLKNLVKDLPAELPASKSARNILAKLLLQTQPAEAAEFAAPRRPSVERRPRRAFAPHRGSHRRQKARRRRPPAQPPLRDRPRGSRHAHASHEARPRPGPRHRSRRSPRKNRRRETQRTRRRTRWTPDHPNAFDRARPSRRRRARRPPAPRKVPQDLGRAGRRPQPPRTPRGSPQALPPSHQKRRSQPRSRGRAANPRDDLPRQVRARHHRARRHRDRRRPQERSQKRRAFDPRGLPPALPRPLRR